MNNEIANKPLYHNPPKMKVHMKFKMEKPEWQKRTEMSFTGLFVQLTVVLLALAASGLFFFLMSVFNSHPK